MSLCSNRPEGFGPHSNIHPNLPTTCFLSVIVVPLASWIYLLVALWGVYLVFREYKQHGSSKRFRSGKSSPDKEPEFKDKPSLTKRILKGLYYVLGLCMLAMNSLQIARLSVAHLGIGLLPFTLARTVIGLCLFFLLGPRRGALFKILSAICWLLLAVCMALLLAALRMEEGPRYNRTGVAKMYPLGDEVTDVGTMVGVAIVLGVLEIVA